MISWSLLIAHTILEITLQFMRVLYDVHRRPLILITTHFILFCYVSDYTIRKYLTIYSDYIIQT